MFRVRVGAMTDLPWVREYLRRKERREYERLMEKEVREEEWKEHMWRTL